MSARYTEVPFHRLYAEIAAAPLCTQESFEHVVQDLIEDTSTTHKRAGAFWEAIEGRLLREFPAVSVDEFTALRDYVWLGSTQAHPQTQKIPLERYLSTLARAILSDSGYELVPQVNASTVLSELSGGSSERFGRECLAWLQRSMPVDLLTNSMQPQAKLANVNQRVRRMLEEEYAETHLHLGASLTFGQLWPCILSSIDDPEFQFDALESRNGSFDHGRGMATWLIRAAIARMLLAEFLFTGTRNRGFCRFMERRRGSIPSSELHVDILQESISLMTNPLAAKRAYSPQEFCLLQSCYRRMIWPLDARVADLPSLQKADPIVSMLPVSNDEVTDAESVLVGGALKYMSSPDGRADRKFRLVFWQSQRIRCLAYRHVTQQHGVPGLVWFTRFYRRISPTRRGKLLTSGKVCAAAATAGLGRGLKSLEVRVAPATSANEILAEVKELAEVSHALNELIDQWGSASAERFPMAEIGRSIDRRRTDPCNQYDAAAPGETTPVHFELGLVLHFVKEREKGSQEFLSAFGRLSHENPALSFRDRYRYRDYFIKCRSKADAICRVLREYPLSLQWLRGVDICNDELAMPTWLFAPLFRQIVDTSKQTSAYLKSTLGLEVPPIRTTAHVGEDFVHLLTGLRRIDEAVEQLSVGEGSRLGHALALGADPRDWARGVGPIAMDKLTRLHDLVWEWSIMNELSELPSFPRAHFIQTHAQRIIDELFSHWEIAEQFDYNQKPTMHDLVILRRNLSNPNMLAAVGFPDQTPGRVRARNWIAPATGRGAQLSARRQSNELEILRQYLTDPLLFQRGRDVMLVKTSQTGETIAAVQDGLRRKIAARGILVEVNPSSNQVVGGIGDLRKHPIWRLTRPEYDDDVAEVAVCVGSDDPLVFATDLQQEYQRLADVLSQLNYSHKAANDWLDMVRRNSLSSKITLGRVSFAPVDSVYTRISN